MKEISDEETEFLAILAQIADPRLRYFYLMLGGAMAESGGEAKSQPGRASLPGRNEMRAAV